MLIKIKNLHLRTIIGVNEWEKNIKQDIVINISIEFDGDKAAQSDDIEDTVNYRSLTKRVIESVENGQFWLLEKLASTILALVMDDKKVIKATVEVDKPHALRFADSVSVTCSRERTP